MLRFAFHPIRRSAVIVVVTVIEHSTVHPRHITPVHGRQRLPQFVVKQHAGVATAAAHQAPPSGTGGEVRRGCWQVIDPSFRRESESLDEVCAIRGGYGIG